MKNAPQGHAAFVASIPKAYDEFLGPVIFVPYAKDVARRLTPLLARGRLLELAAGTGIVTRTVGDALPRGVELTDSRGWENVCATMNVVIRGRLPV